MVGKTAWLLNLDAESELAEPGALASSRAVRTRVVDLGRRLGPLVRPGDVVVDRDAPLTLPAEGFTGRCWCPTPSARRVLAAVGATLAPSPAFEVLRRVNHRRFCAELGRALPGAIYVEDVAEAERVICSGSPTGKWLLRRAFGFAGRGRRLVEARALDSGTRGWIESSIASGGLDVSPWVERLADFALHGHIGRDRAIQLGAPTRQECDERGAWRASVRADPGDLGPDELCLLTDAANGAAAALARAGYFGPFGIDAFRWRDGSGSARFEPRCEINARYSMGWAVGMAPSRPDLA